MANFKSALVLSVAVLFLSGCFENKENKAAAGRQMPLSHVDIFIAQKTDIPISFDYTATVTSSQDVIIYPKVGGTIIKQFFRPGSKVKAGDKLFLIDPEKYQASFDSLDAAVGVANANLKNAETEFKRISALYKKNAVSQKDYDAAVAAYDIANANLVSAKANLKNAKIDLGYTTITAPFDGVVGDNQVDVGSLVIANQTKLVRLTKINPIEAEFYIADVDNLTRKTNLDNGSWQQLNSDAVLSVNGENFNGKVNFIDKVEIIGDWQDSDFKKAQNLLKNLMPWRKGPFFIGDGIDKHIHIDTEWRSDFKWNRVSAHLDLVGKRILDVGGGSGYHGFRMMGAGAKSVVVIDPSCLFYHQFMAIKHFSGEQNIHFLPVALEQLPTSEFFDTVFSMGVLYHRMSPFEHLEQLKSQLKKGGTLVLETLVVDGDDNTVLVPQNRYAQMNNVYFLPSVSALKIWLKKTGFYEITCVDIDQTSIKE